MKSLLTKFKMFLKIASCFKCPCPALAIISVDNIEVPIRNRVQTQAINQRRSSERHVKDQSNSHILITGLL